MKKSEIAKGLDIKATSVFIVTAIALILNSLISNILRIDGIPAVVEKIGSGIAFVSVIFYYEMQIRGFTIVNKACKLCEKNENYYMGRNLTIFSVVCIVVTVILTVLAMIFAYAVAQYNVAEVLTPSEIQSRNNIVAITAVINIAMQFFSVSTPFIFYLWKIYKLSTQNKLLNNLTLLTCIVFVVQLVIGILNAIYAARGTGNSFLPDFTSILHTIKYIVLLVFFIYRKQYLVSAETEE